MSITTLVALHDPVAAHLADTEDDTGFVLGNWFLAYDASRICDDGIVSHVCHYTTSPTSSPSAALGVAQLGTAYLIDDLTRDPDDE